jgi:hypothetical protein
MKTVTLPLDKLIAYAGNPRKNDHAVEAVASAIKRFGFRVPVLAKSDGSLIDGHLRVKAAKHLGMEEVPVVLCDDLSEADIKALRISINRMAELAEWDAELLSAELEGLAAEGIGLEDVGFDESSLKELGALLDQPPGELGEGQYTKKITVPIYEPQGPKPPVSELFDSEKTERLLQKISEANLSEEIEKFLCLAAHRHAVFNFQQIAEYYAHSEPEVQRLFEESALVIVDFNKALESGYVTLGEKLRDSYLEDFNNEQ